MGVTMTKEDRTKPLDELLNEKMEEFESGEEREQDKELDNMIWELGDYESQEPPQEAEEYEEKPQIEEELVEKDVLVRKVRSTENP